MEEKKYLNEKKYRRIEKFITLIAFLILIVGLYFGGFLIYKGVAKPDIPKLEKLVAELKVQLETKKQELEAKGVKFNVLAKYFDGEEYDLKIIIEALDPSSSNCYHNEYKNNSLTKEYCVARNNLETFDGGGFIALGVFICIVTCMIAGFIFVFAKRRHILAFSTQQVMPVAKEGIDEMAPTIGNAAGEIAKGIKKGLKDTDDR